MLTFPLVTTTTQAAFKVIDTRTVSFATEDYLTQYYITFPKSEPCGSRLEVYGLKRQAGSALLGPWVSPCAWRATAAGQKRRNPLLSDLANHDLILAGTDTAVIDEFKRVLSALAEGKQPTPAPGPGLTPYPSVPSAPPPPAAAAATSADSAGAKPEAPKKAAAADAARSEAAPSAAAAQPGGPPNVKQVRQITVNAFKLRHHACPDHFMHMCWRMWLFHSAHCCPLPATLPRPCSLLAVIRLPT